MRLNQYLAKSGITSRRNAEKLIRGKRVKINQKPVDKLSCRVKPGDRVQVDGNTAKPEENICILVNKPEGVTTTCSDRFAKATILDLIPRNILLSQRQKKRRRLYPAGRLDKNSSGLIIVTNDGYLCQAITHPKFEIEKEYLIRLSKPFAPEDIEKAKAGITDAGQVLKVKNIKTGKKDKRIIKVVVREGKKRHLRRLLKKLDYKITRLQRIRIGRIRLASLGRKRTKTVSPAQARNLLGIDG